MRRLPRGSTSRKGFLYSRSAAPAMIGVPYIGGPPHPAGISISGSQAATMQINVHLDLVRRPGDNYKTTLNRS